MSQPAEGHSAPQLRRTMGLWDVLLFNIAAVLGPRWIAAAAHNGTSSLSLWVLAAVLFFVPSSLIIVELSSRFPHEGGLYIWTKEAFGDFHGFVAGWAYWVYTFFYFPGLLLASAAMAAYIRGGGQAAQELANDRTFLVAGALILLGVALVMNIIGLNIGKWLQNAGGVSTYVPLLILAVVGFICWNKFGTQNPITAHNALPHLDLDTVNFWSQIAFAFTGLELCCAMAGEVKDPKRNFPRAIFGSGLLIALIYIVGTVALLAILPAGQVDPKSGVFQATSHGSALLGLGFLGVLAAMLVSVGNAGGVGATVAGVARVPFVVGIDRYLPSYFGKMHPRWKTPYISMLIQAGISAAILLLSQYNQSVSDAYQQLVDAAIILYFIPFLYMYAAAIRLAYRKDRESDPEAVLVSKGKLGVWIAGILGFAVTLVSIAFSMIPPGTVENKPLYELKLLGGCAAAILVGLVLYWTSGSRKKT